ncbi:urease accessory protein F isoform X1 [Canna indica]|uniref:Urease accessory protein F isoform X1 n=1 Tax=Canna indica TaxID=4628 RepID=A0AAQ3QFG4_9LILI|nr:urease accessory protein F isoform X1 [Canna indica]
MMFFQVSNVFALTRDGDERLERRSALQTLTARESDAIDFFMECDMDTDKGNDAAGRELLQWSQWQLMDSVLPTGGFAHSYGLEAAVQTQFVTSPLDLKPYIVQVLENTGSLLLPFVYCAYISPDIANWSKLDKLLEATLTNEVSRKASASQGSALLRVAASVYLEVPSLKRMRDAYLGSGTAYFHHAPIFGLICGLLGFDSNTCQKMYLFTTMRDVISAATRLNLIGPLGASVLQHQLAPVAERITKKWMDHPVEEACQVAPLLDTVQGLLGHNNVACLPKLRFSSLFALARDGDELLLRRSALQKPTAREIE